MTCYKEKPEKLVQRNRNRFVKKIKNSQITWPVLLLFSALFCLPASVLAEDAAVNHDAWYLAKPDEYATIQLSAYESEADAIAYITENGLTGDIGYYLSTHNNKPWYAVTYGVFRSTDEARNYLKKLPAELRRHSPWARSFSEIKSLISSSAENRAVNKKRAGERANKQANPESPEPVNWENGQAAYDAGDFGNAFKTWQKLAQQGDSLSQFNLAVMYSRGEGTEQNGGKAIEWYIESAEQGYAPAQFNLGAAYLEGKFITADEQQAASWWLTAAEQGFVQAQFNLASLYCRGIGVPRDMGKCKYWYGRAAANGDTHARKMLDHLASNQRDSKPSASIEQKDKSVAPGVADTASVAKPESSSSSAEENSDTSNSASPAVRKTSSAERIQLRKAQGAFTRNDYIRSHDLWLPLAESGIAEAQYSLGFLYQSGWGVAQDLPKAVSWYSLAAAQDETRAQFNLGVLLLTGEAPVAQDVEAAMVWLNRSAEGGNTRAKEFLVDAYNHGKYGIRKSPEKAEYWKSR